MQLLNKDVTMLQRMESDLREKAKSCLASESIKGKVFGVFALDELETAMESEIVKQIGVGVSYIGADVLAINADPKASAAPAGGAGARMVRFGFLIVLAVPTQRDCEERFDAGEVLTALRLHIHGSRIDGDAVARTWGFERETPNIEQSSDTMLFYSQVWRVALPNVGP